ncbi:MAG: RNA-guided endonuclease InsQ/TnpB family protein [Candidatus Hydrothermarchaeales archaeon]
MKKTFKFRLYSNRDQKELLGQTLETCRILYNNALAERRVAWKKEKRSVGYHEQAVALPFQKASDPYLPQVHSQVLQDVLKRVDKTYQNYFRRLELYRQGKGEKPGYPRYKGYYRYDSFTYPQSGFKIEGKKLVLSKIGSVDIKLHRPIEGTVKTCTIRRDVDRWYACFTVELPDVAAEKRGIANAVGVDVGLSSLVTLSTGEKIEPPKFLRKIEEKLAREQRRLSRKKKGSKNRLKQRLKVAKLHRKIREQRTDFNHKLSRKLVDTYDLIAFEDLRIRNMLQNHHLAKSISESSWYMLQGLTAYKAGEAGKQMALVDPNGTSQECSNCGEKVGKNLSVRMHECPYCGLVLDRDVNAAINILKRAVGEGLADLMPVGGLPLGTPLKQEAIPL